jgi:hypothetical protein
MAALYTRYSSSHVFGAENDSPDALRLYAEALLRKAYDEAPELLPKSEFKDWLDRLRGENGTLTCTAFLYHMQSQRLDAILRQPGSGLLHQVRDEMIPLPWR